MIKKINVMGVELDNHAFAESLTTIEQFLKDTAVSVVLTVDMDQIVLACQDDIVREQLSAADHTIVIDKAILEAAGEASASRERELDEKDFFLEFMKVMYHSNQSFFLIAASESEEKKMQKLLLEQFPHLNIVGSGVVTEKVDENEALINTINIVVPDILLSSLPSPGQEHFLHEHKKQICAKIWYSVGPELRKSKGGGLIGFMRRAVENRILRSRLSKIENDKKET